MTIQNYLQTELETCSVYALTDEDKKLLEGASIEEFIFKKLSSKKFRKWSLDASSEEKIKGAIALNIAANKPIQFTFPFGGYKLWSLPTAPEVDWAEFFTIAYYMRWVAPIAAAYKPGVQFIFSSDDVIVEKLDNIPPADTKSYFNSFIALISHFTKHLPSNLTLEIRRVGDLYEKAEFEKEFEENFEVIKKAYENPDPERYEKMLQTSKLNYQWKGVEDFSHLSDAEKEEKIKLGPIIHDAYGKAKKRRAFVRGEDKIVTFTTPIPNAIAIGTTKNSVTKFWTGYGVLEEKEEGFANRILSPEQLAQFQKEPHKTEEVNLIDLANFKTIDVSKPLNFAKH